MATNSSSDAVARAVPAYLRTSNFKDSTKGSYALDVRLLLDWCAGCDIDPAMLTLTDAEAFLSHQESKGNIASTVDRRIRALKGFYNWLLEHGSVDTNPFAELEWSSPDKNYRTALSTTELRRMWNACLTDREHVVVGLLGICGARPQELEHARVEDLTESDGYRLLKIRTRSRLHEVPFLTIPWELWPYVERLIAGRQAGPLLLRNDGNGADRRTIYRWTTSVGKRSQIASSTSALSLTFAMRAAAVRLGLSFATVVRSAGDGDPRSLNRWATEVPFRVDEYPSVRVVREVVSDGNQPEDHLANASVLLQTPVIPPAVAATYAASALEAQLRTLALLAGYEPASKAPKLGTYAAFLKREDLLSVPDVVTINQIQVIRDDAAHGRFDLVSRTSASWLIRACQDLVRRYPKAPDGG